MRCPFCNQNHPDDYQFCPITGNKIEPQKACTNLQCSEYGRHILPSDCRYCPKCGEKINDEKESYEFNPRKTISSVEDFRQGNIIIDGVILGRTPAIDLDKFPKEFPYGYYSLMDGAVNASGEMTDEHFNRILEISEQYDPNIVNRIKDRVWNFSIHEVNIIPFLREIGFRKEWRVQYDDDEIVRILEDNGYSRIEHPIIRREFLDWAALQGESFSANGLNFISNVPNASGNKIWISWSINGPLSIGISWLKEWITYYDGVKHFL